MTIRRKLVRLMQSLLHCFLVLMIFCSGSLNAYAQAGDTEPPSLTYESIERGVVNEAQLFIIEATDNVELATVTFAYRVEDNADYRIVPMARQGATDTYSVTLTAEEIGAGSQFIQYYIEAADTTGNRTLEGFAFNPLTRALVDASEISPPAVQAEAGPLSQFSELSTGKKILYGALGVLAVGALIAATDSGGASVEPGVDVTVVVDQLPIDN